ncbi:DgyrCDS5781 [Dimorphilus gyrociliatus]|uniref:DgyrCDS5781 n=1 Tax=Dimorphilus gyrociliatus TaxID=2664684 RepID=A0A7I8VKY3_9ANNE|nr:DgyrCDS5781 [Dimorphilus gyrociliatus]
MLHDTPVSPAFNNANGEMKTELGDESNGMHIKTETGPAAPNVKDEVNGEQQQQPQQQHGATPVQTPANGFPAASPADFMQHQSQIYVFSTEWANKAADSVESGIYKSIIAYHYDQPETKSMIQKMPNLKPPTGLNMPTSSSSNLQAMSAQPGPSPSPSSMQMHMASNYMTTNIHQSKVPNENLTPEQRARREEQLASLRNLQKMLFPEQQQQHPNHPAMMQQHGMMAPSSGPMPFNPGGPPHLPMQRPMSWEHMNPAQREWHKLQQDYYIDKFKRGPGPPPPGPHGQFPMRPMSPQMQPMPLSPSGMPPAPPNGQFPPMRPMSPASQMQPPPAGMSMPSPADMPPNPPNGPGMPPSNNPSPVYSSGPPTSLMGPPSMPNSMPDGMMMPGEMMPHLPPSSNDYGVFQRAGPPDQLKPSDLQPAPEAKPPPSYAAAAANEPPVNSGGTKRKRTAAAAELDENHRKLQPAPSPKQFSYLTQFDGQELTITRQLNSAFKDSNSEEQPSPAPPASQTNSPPNTPRSPSTPIPARANTPCSTPALQGHPPTPTYSSVPSVSSITSSSSLTYTSNVMSTPSYSAPFLSSGNPTVYTNSGPKMTNITSASLAALADLATKAPQSCAAPQERTSTPRSMSPNVLSPGVRHSNANVHVQAKAPNTIQYLPANPPSSQPMPSTLAPPMQGQPPHPMTAMMGGGGEALMSTMDFDQGPMMMPPGGPPMMDPFHQRPPHHHMQPGPPMYMRDIRGGPPPRQGPPHPGPPLPHQQQQMHMHPMHHPMMHGERFNGPGSMFY